MPTWGRGGAGNIISNEEVKKTERRIKEDVEAQNFSPYTPPAIETSATSAPAQVNSRATGDANHLGRSGGRGGAGNFTYSSAESTSAAGTGQVPGVPPPTPVDATAGTAIARSQGQYYGGGRGGAGNILAAAAQAAAKEEDANAQERAVVEERIAGEVDRELEKPGQAVIRDHRGKH